MENMSPEELIKSFGIPKENKELTEECFQLKIKHFGKKVIHPLKPLSCFDRPRRPQGRSGKFYIQGPTGKLFISYEVNFTRGEPAFELFFTKDATNIDGGHNQTIKLETQELHYGTRWYFTCECGKRCNILYLSSRSGFFACRTCQNLAYESSRINKKTMNGLLYYTSRKLKLAKIRESLDRISYNGRPTKRATRFFRMLEELENSVDNATKSQANHRLLQVCT